MKRIILHIDFDSFFASVAQQDNALLRRRPIGITATNGRTAIIAASREAKARGIKSPSRTFEAQKMCPDIIFVAANFVRYWEISKTFLSICSKYSPYVEVFSIDEVFMDVTLTAHLFGDVYSLVEKIKQELKEKIGEYITASVGISHNKLLAKLASGMKKPNGVIEITPENVLAIYKAAKLTDICGIGERIKARLNQMGIYTLLNLRAAPLSSLVAEFGNVEGHFLKNIGLAIDESPVVCYTDVPSVKSVGRNYCLPQNEYDKRKVLQNLYELCEEVAIKLRRLQKKARTIGFSLRGEQIIGGRHTFTDYMDTGKEIFEGCIFILCACHAELVSASPTEILKLVQDDIGGKFKGYTRQISIWASGLENTGKLTLPLLQQSQKLQKITEIIDKVNEKFGDHTIRNGFLLYADKLTTVPNGWMADKYERTKLAVSA